MTTSLAHISFGLMRQDYLDQYFTFLRFPSISTDDAYTENVGECAHWLVEKLNGIGLEAKLIPTPGHPDRLGEKQTSARPQNRDALWPL